jgi:hypothetical protein
VGNSDEDDGTSLGGDGGAGERFFGGVAGFCFLLASRYILSTCPEAPISSKVQCNRLYGIQLHLSEFRRNSEKQGYM